MYHLRDVSTAGEGTNAIEKAENDVKQIDQDVTEVQDTIEKIENQVEETGKNTIEKSETQVEDTDKTENEIKQPVEDTNKKTENEVKPVENAVEKNEVIEANDTEEAKHEDHDDFTDAMMENIEENFNQDVDGMVSLMESAEEFMFESGDKQQNIKAAIEANKRKQEQEKKSAINSDKSEAYSLLAQGKRNLFVKDYESAVTTLGEACEKLSSIYGEFAVELADAYLTYGNALLELWRVEEAEKKNTEEPEPIKADDEEVEEPDEQETENDNEEKEDGDDERNDEEAEEDIENEEDNLQIAWEVVETARAIYERNNDNLNLAKAYLKLGEISIASANYSLAIDDLNRSLEIHQKLDPVDNRLKANIHFNLYVAYSASHNYDKSAEQLDTAKSVFQNQVDDLTDKLKTLDQSNLSEIAKIKNEINDTEEILRDMDSKILENNKHKREFMTALFEAIKNKTSDGNHSGESNAQGFGGSSSAAPVNNISHLIHKKPKPKSDTDQSPKKQNPAIVNGDSLLNSESESSNGSHQVDDSKKNDDQNELNEKKRRLSDSQDSSPKKVCLSQE